MEEKDSLQNKFGDRIGHCQSRSLGPFHVLANLGFAFSAGKHD